MDIIDFSRVYAVSYNVVVRGSMPSGSDSCFLLLIFHGENSKLWCCIRQEVCINVGEEGGEGYVTGEARFFVVEFLSSSGRMNRTAHCLGAVTRFSVTPHLGTALDEKTGDGQKRFERQRLFFIICEVNTDAQRWKQTSLLIAAARKQYCPP